MKTHLETFLCYLNTEPCRFRVNFQMVQLLLEKGATINTFDKKDRRAVHWTAFQGHIDVVRLLVNFGAELGCRDKQVWHQVLRQAEPFDHHIDLRNAG